MYDGQSVGHFLSQTGRENVIVAVLIMNRLIALKSGKLEQHLMTSIYVIARFS